MTLSKGKKAGLIIALAVVLLVIDQVTKILVKTNMQLGESIPVLGNWFQILFIENEGMAFGMSFGGDIGKYILTSFRLILSVLLFVYVRHLLLKKDAPVGVLLGLTAIMTGAVGNLIDCMFYGLIFEPSSYTHVASAVPFGDGYGKFLFPHYKHSLAGLGAVQRRGVADIFPSDIQHRRFLCHRRCPVSADLQVEVFPDA